jgi:2-methylcitrate dehydratase
MKLKFDPNEMTLAGWMARYTKSLKFEDLPPEVIHQSKRLVLDTLGCCIGAYEADAVKILHGLIEELDGPKESTVLGSGLRTSCFYAALLNGLMVRYLDYNDVYVVPAGKWYAGGHPSESIPGILAVGEREHTSGKELIAAMVVSYELSARFCRSITNPPISKLGWNEETKGVYVMPLAAGLLLRLSEKQLENAVGISGCHGMILGILDTAAEEYSMTKSLRYPFTAHEGIFAAMLAKRGFTGPTTVIEGSDGFIQTVTKGNFDIERFTATDDAFYIMETGFKAVCAVGAVNGHLNATLALVNRHDIKPEDVAQVKITAGTRPIEHTGDPAKKYPTNKETADHSSYYLTAIALIDRTVGPDQYQPWKYKDPQVLQLIDRITLKIDPEMDKLPRSGMSEIVTKDGKHYRERFDYPKGDPKNPMSDVDLEQKFTSMASKFMNQEQIERVIQTVYRLDTLEDAGDLTKKLIFEKRK